MHSKADQNEALQENLVAHERDRKSSRAINQRKIMYEVLRNGTPMKHSRGNLQQVVALIRLLETGIDRFTQHSPFTIGKVKSAS